MSWTETLNLSDSYRYLPLLTVKFIIFQMFTFHYLVEMQLKNRESMTVEFKRSLSEFSDILATVSAFSNTKGGIILVGVDDQGNVLGVQIGKRTLEDLSNKIVQNTDPKIYPEIKIEEIHDKKVIEIKVSERSDKPVFAKGIAYKRVGRSNVKMDREEIVNLLRKTYELSYEDIEISNIEDIDLSKVKEFIEKARKRRLALVPKDEISVLRNLGLISDKKVKLAALLVFGENPQAKIPWATVKIGKFLGETTPILEKEIGGDLLEQIEKSYTETASLIRKEIKVDGLKRKEIYEYPLQALRELIINSITHRDYSVASPIYIKIFNDHVEIENPGGLPPGITLEDLKKPHRSILRNPKIANILYNMGYIEKWGVGTLQVLEKCILNGNGEPIFNSNGFFKAEIKSRYSEETGENERKILNYILKKGKTTRKELEKELKLKESTIRKLLGKLQRKGLIVKEGKGKKTKYKLVF